MLGRELAGGCAGSGRWSHAAAAVSAQPPTQVWPCWCLRSGQGHLSPGEQGEWHSVLCPEWTQPLLCSAPRAGPAGGCPREAAEGPAFLLATQPRAVFSSLRGRQWDLKCSFLNGIHPCLRGLWEVNAGGRGSEKQGFLDTGPSHDSPLKVSVAGREKQGILWVPHS